LHISDLSRSCNNFVLFSWDVGNGAVRGRGERARRALTRPVEEVIFHNPIGVFEERVEEDVVEERRVEEFPGDE
jgi:hypothetical protein